MTSIEESVQVASVGVRPVAGHIGADITGVDMSGPLSAGQVEAVREALHRYKVIFFRGQHLDHDAHIAFGRQFGDLTCVAPPRETPEGYPEITTVGRPKMGPGQKGPGQKMGPQGEGQVMKQAARGRPSYFSGWHTDVTGAVNPPLGCILRAEAVPEFGGDTTWTNLAAAYEGLSDRVKGFVRTLRAEHRFGAGTAGMAGAQIRRGDGGGQQAGNAAAAQRFTGLVAIHPVVRVHPVTGERVLFVNPGFTSHIEDVSRVESTAILDLLYAEMTRQEYTVRLRWEPGTVAFWDNYATAHCAPFDIAADQHAKRVLHRVTLLGEVPVGTDGQESEIVDGEPLTTVSKKAQ